ncbi:MAG: OB-fold domain-containing protein [Frankia sp.]|nr:OB-fold domain-containing protein [Frankia sp.]
MPAHRVPTEIKSTGTISPNSAPQLLAPQTAGVPFAARTPLTEPFWAGCARGELLFQRCAACGAPGFPPAVACRACLGRDLRWERSTGLATLYSWTVVHRPVSPAFHTPYAPAIVTLAEGHQMLTCLIGLEVADIRPGMPLRVSFHPVLPAGAADGDEPTVLPYFAPAAPLPPHPHV